MTLYMPTEKKSDAQDFKWQAHAVQSSPYLFVQKCIQPSRFISIFPPIFSAIFFAFSFSEIEQIDFSCFLSVPAYILVVCVCRVWSDMPQVVSNDFGVMLHVKVPLWGGTSNELLLTPRECVFCETHSHCSDGAV